MLLISLAWAHPADVPHLHPDDPAAIGILAFWLVAGMAFLALAHRGLRQGTRAAA